MHTSANVILAGASEFARLCEILRKEQDLCMVSVLREETGELMKEFRSQKGDLYLIPSTTTLEVIEKALAFWVPQIH